MRRHVHRAESLRVSEGASVIGVCAGCCAERDGFRTTRSSGASYCEEKLQVRRRRGRKRTLGTKAPLTVTQGVNQRWPLDFVSDAFACGRRFRILAVVDDFSRDCVRLIADTSISGARVGRELDAAAFERMAGHGRLDEACGRYAPLSPSRRRLPTKGSFPMCYGTELTSMTILHWSKDRAVE